ncbi:Uncharacterised protein [Mycobacteroides abscessus subsp. bolletii]|uniref:hypothetical protein n=1 Tax=Mycobacteroides abscessus TaxID=36809 RepID=UPI000925AD5B|nr:hypothetical protein [Mycobacteroides abscessus]QSM90795.1 hypothetical protein I3U44_09165 [Mycobacteroides abscessus subsp. bolletii]SIJ01938.1 Uncharacterised protein [Mycobacteroides abscessus subsp. bolletii]SLD37138.1 Uncharacterised protein [Mycobacteroides abscessus subsp. bolletii]
MPAVSDFQSVALVDLDWITVMMELAVLLRQFGDTILESVGLFTGRINCIGASGGAAHTFFTCSMIVFHG